MSGSLQANLAAGWRNRQIPDLEGILCSSGEVFEFQDQQIVRAEREPVIKSWLSVGILAQAELYGGQYAVRCGEATAHGSIGVIVLESLQSGDLLWTFASERTNLFDQIEIKGSSVLVLSTSGAVFRFRCPLQEAGLFL